MQMEPDVMVEVFAKSRSKLITSWKKQLSLSIFSKLYIHITVKNSMIYFIQTKNTAAASVRQYTKSLQINR